MKGKICVVGAGVIGRYLTTELIKANYQVTLFDQNSPTGEESCSWVAGGMLAPYCEWEKCDDVTFQLGKDSLPLWKDFSARLGPVFFQQAGTLVVAHPQEHRELLRFKSHLEHKGIKKEQMVSCEQGSLRELEPGLDRRFQAGLFFPWEGQISARHFMGVTTDYLQGQQGQNQFSYHPFTKVLGLGPHWVKTEKETHPCDWVIDTRGLGAKDTLPLRGIRGELVRIKARENFFHRPIRLLHPRYPLYIIPRPQGEFLVGATALESEDLSPISVRSLLELLSACFSLHSGFGEAAVVETNLSLRPTLTDHRPAIYSTSGLIQINGLYRHGYMVTPKIAQIVMDFLYNGQWPSPFKDICHEAVYSRSTL